MGCSHIGLSVVWGGRVMQGVYRGGRRVMCLWMVASEGGEAMSDAETSRVGELEERRVVAIFVSVINFFFFFKNMSILLGQIKVFSTAHMYKPSCHEQCHH